MKNESHEELIGAYVDGELTPSEQVRVEQLLDQNPEYRQLYEELRTLRQGFAAMPRYRLTENLGPQVLRRAEREMLVGAAKKVEPADSDDVLAEIARADRTTLRRPRNRRRVWLWPGVALAAALLILVANWLKTPSRVANNTEGPAAPVGAMGVAPPAVAEGQASRPQTLAREPAETSRRQRGRAYPAEKNDRGLAGNQIPLPSAAQSDATAEERPDEKALATEDSRTDVPGVDPSKDEKAQLPTSDQKRDAGFAEGVLVVKCDVHADGVRNRTFQKLLANEHIEWHGLGPSSATDAAQPEPNVLALPDAAVYVEATPGQVRNILRELMERTDEFASVETRAQPGIARQRLFAVYNRPNVAIHGSRDSVAKSDEAAGVNARALPDTLITDKAAEPTADKPGFEVEKPRKTGSGAKSAKSPTTKKPVAAHPAKSAAKPAAETAQADGEAPAAADANAAEEDARPLHVLFMFRLVAADGWPMTDSP